MQHIIVQTDGEVFQFPLSDIGIVLIETTRAVISTYALSQCAKNHIKVISCDEKGMPISEITPYAYNKTGSQTCAVKYSGSKATKTGSGSMS